MNRNGLRVVAPYYGTKRIRCRGRWFGRQLEQVLSTEFLFNSGNYFKRAVANGNVAIFRIQGGKQVIRGPEVGETELKCQDIIECQLHFHEQPIPYFDDIKVIYEDEEILVVDKPSGVPTHPVGKYNLNTALRFLEERMGQKLYTVNRIDKLTSGLLILAKTSKAANKYTVMLSERQVIKEYIAKVRGEFPGEAVTCQVPIFELNVNLPMDEILKSIDRKKPALTEFELIKYDGSHSIVRCRPLTGRTHQIRKHLALLGFPIANDRLYNDKSFVHLSSMVEQFGTTRPDILEATLLKMRQVSSEYRELQLCGICNECEGDLFVDPDLSDLQIWLHSRSYRSSTGSWSFKTSLPEWAT